MKKTILYLPLAFVAVMSSGCKKNNAVLSEETVVEVTMNTNESYKYTLPVAEDPSSYAVESVAARSAIVDIESDSNSSTFVYTPAADYSGTDVVVISSSGDSKEQNACGKTSKTQDGQCKKATAGREGCKKRGRHTITFNITVNGVQN